MHCYTVCVDYWDYLQTTLPLMLKWFDGVTVITASDQPEHAAPANVRRYPTDAFYRNGAVFNKGQAFEECWQDNPLSGWVCVMDADILLPDCPRAVGALAGLEIGNIYSPRRRQLPLGGDPSDPWNTYPLCDDSITKCPGFMQVFHTTDPILRRRPWYPTHWKHAGGCDSDFCEKWPKARQKRLDFDVLHFGETRRNWCGRVTPYLDGAPAANAAQHNDAMQAILLRRRNGNLKHEQLPRVRL